MFCTVIRLFIFCCIAIVGLVQAKTDQIIPWNNLGAEATKKSGGKGLTVTELWNGYGLECKMQALRAEVAMSGAKIISTSKSEGEGEFTIRTSRLGRKTSMDELGAVADWITIKDGIVQTGRGGVVEEYSTSGDGIRQDFVITNKPEGQGRFLLDISVEGKDIKVKHKQDGMELRFSSGRVLSYHALKVTDANGHALVSRFLKAKNNNIIISVDDKNAVYPVRVDPTISDADWMSMGEFPGIKGDILALAVDQKGNLYAGGRFTIAGSAFAKNIAKWNGSSWSALGSGINQDVWSIEVDKSGNVFAGGAFDTAGGVAANLIAKWDGSLWSVLGSGLINGRNIYVVYTLAFDSLENLYVGGSFNLSGGASANYIAKWNGSSWNALESGTNNIVQTLAIDNFGELYAAGYFDTAGGKAVNHIAKWDGNSWSALGSGLIKGNMVSALAIDRSGNLFAGGFFDTIGGIVAHNIAKWDGRAWSAIGSGLSNGNRSSIAVCALAVDQSGNLIAGGLFDTAGGMAVNDIAKWDGGAWITLGAGINNAIGTIKVDDQGNLYAASHYGSETGRNTISKWNGSSWSALDKGTDFYVDVLAFDGSDNLYAGGDFTTIGRSGMIANHIAKWDGSVWIPLGSGTNGSVRSLTFDNSGNIFAGGNFTTAGNIIADNIAKWDGNAWSSLGSGLNDMVQDVVVDGLGNLFAGGWFDTAGGISVKHIAKWDGNAWTALGTGIDREVMAFAVDDSNGLYVGGAFDTAGGIEAKHIAKWKDGVWSTLGSGTNGTVLSLVIDKTGNLYAGGSFDTAGGTSTNLIAKWDGNSWNALGSGMGRDVPIPRVFTLAFDRSGNLIAGGLFDTAGGMAVNNIAKWDGRAWSVLGSGTNNNVWTLAIDNSSNLYAGGWFTYAGGKISPYIAQCRLNGSAVIPRKTYNTSQPFSNYNAHANLLHFNLPSQTQIAYRIYSLSGRQIFSASETMGAGDHSMRINTGNVAKGMYIVHFKAGDESMRFRLVVDK